MSALKTSMLAAQKQVPPLELGSADAAAASAAVRRDSRQDGHSDDETLLVHDQQSVHLMRGKECAYVWRTGAHAAAGAGAQSVAQLQEVLQRDVAAAEAGTVEPILQLPLV